MIGYIIKLFLTANMCSREGIVLYVFKITAPLTVSAQPAQSLGFVQTIVIE